MIRLLVLAILVVVVWLGLLKLIDASRRGRIDWTGGRRHFRSLYRDGFLVAPRHRYWLTRAAQKCEKPLNLSPSSRD